MYTYVFTFKKSFAVNCAKSGKLDIFKKIRFEFFSPAIFWGLVVCVVKMWLDRKKKAVKIPGAKITWYSLLITYGNTTGARQQPAAFAPKTFERKLWLFCLKEPLTKLQKSFCFCNFH